MDKTIKNIIRIYLTRSGLMFVAFLIFFCLDASFVSANSIEINSYTKVNNDLVYLNDIAILDSDDKSFDEFLGSIKITQAPAPSKKKFIKKITIMNKILNVLNKIHKNYTLNIPEIVTVESAYRAIPEKILEGIFYQQVKDINSGRDFKIKRFRVRGNIIFPDRKLRFEPDSFSSNKKYGKLMMKISVFSGAEFLHNIFVSAWVDVFEPVLTLKKSVKKGEIISSADIELKKVNISKITSDYMIIKENAVGMVAKRQLIEGSVLMSKLLSEPHLIEKGDLVKVKLHSGNLLIESAGIAKSDGFIGDQIEVKNSYTGKMMLGRVMDKDLIEIIF